MIYVVLGTKAQLIKMAPVMKELSVAGIEYKFVHTGQHKETMTEMYEDFDIKGPDCYLYDGEDITSIFSMVQWVGRILWQTFSKRKTVFNVKENSIVLVHGDTFSTLLGALMGKVAHIKVGHVESGLRSFNLFNPFPKRLPES